MRLRIDDSRFTFHVSRVCLENIIIDDESRGIIL